MGPGERKLARNFQIYKKRLILYAGWTSGALKNRIQRLRATARAEETSTPIPKAKSASPPASTPDPATPSKKRKRNPTPRTPRATKGKKEDTAQSIEEESENMKELAEALTKCETEKRNDDDSSIDI